MINPRQLVRAAMKAALADLTTGFNTRLAAIAASYGITAFSISFAAGSTSFVESYIDPSGAFEVSRLLSEPAGLALYTSAAQDLTSGERSLMTKFDGQVSGHLDFYLRFTGGIETAERDTESYADAVEDAVLQVLHDPAVAGNIFSGPVYYNGDFSCDREPVIQIQDGYEQRIPLVFSYTVTI